MIHFYVLDSSGDKVSGIQVKLDFGDELSSGERNKEKKVDSNKLRQWVLSTTNVMKETLKQTNDGSLTKRVLSSKVNAFSFIIKGQIAIKKESDGNDNKLIGISR